MKRLIIVIGSLLMMIVILLKCSAPTKSTTLSQGALSSNILPQDCLDSCTVTQAQFAGWFDSGHVKADSLVDPANSVTFLLKKNCDFYRWSEQMFLWITSPMPNGSGSVFESSQFYDVSPAVKGIRSLTQHQPGLKLNLSSHIEQTGPNRLPIVITKSGKLLEIEKTAPVTNNKLSAVKNGAGSVVTIAKVKTNDKGVLEFFDGSGKVIDHPKALIHHKNQKGFVQKFTDGKTTVFLDDQGPVQTESGQDTGDVLMSQNGSLVYYLLTVNDMFAWYLKACDAGKMDSTHFPTTAAARDSIVAYADSNGEKSGLIDRNTLAMEIKTSWVEASTLTDPQDYFTVQAIIPTYKKTDSLWTRMDTTKTVLMAMVGMHVVGSANQHGEMIWSTFEHQSNAPNAAYGYLNMAGKKITVPADSGQWRFNANGPVDSDNMSHMRDAPVGSKVVSENIHSTPGFKISASNTRRIFAWGNNTEGTAPNREDTSAAEANSKIISLNQVVHAMLVDRRTNYRLTGATWTDAGVPPDGTSYSENQSPGAAVGTSTVANSTMETYIQVKGTTCLFCHRDHASPTFAPGGLSHIFDDLIRGLNEAALPGKPKGLKAKRSSM